MKATDLHASQKEDESEKTQAGAPASKSGKLGLLMNEREEVASRLAMIDSMIWALEEIYRREPVKAPHLLSGTLVPRGSLTREGGKPQR